MTAARNQSSGPSIPQMLHRKAIHDLLDWAESLLCNAVPMPHCTQDEWDKAVGDWRDGKHSMFPDGPERAREIEEDRQILASSDPSGNVSDNATGASS